MNLSRPIFISALLAALCGATVGSSQELGDADAQTPQETAFEEISDVTVSYRRIFSDHTYDIEIPNTAVGDMIQCSLYDTAGDIIENYMMNSLSRETKVTVRPSTEAETIRCFTVEAERLVRPVGQP